MQRSTDAFVVGLGVSGLSSGIRLLEAGLRVHALGALPPLATTSAVAAAVWYPYRVGPLERVEAWAAASLRAFSELAAQGLAGVRWVDGLEVLPPGSELTSWQRALPDLREAQESELPPGIERAIAFRVPLIEMPTYLAWLFERYQSLGGTHTVAELGSLRELPASAELIVNCSGLGARTLVGDEELYPIRGQLVRIPPGYFERFVVDDTGGDDFAFLVPRSTDAILGGTAHAGRDELALDPAQSDAIVERCSRFAPALRRATRLEERVGLRPGRAAVRLELEHGADGRAIIHDYGHGGAGITLSWGCADEVARLAASFLPSATRSGRA